MSYVIDDERKRKLTTGSLTVKPRKSTIFYCVSTAGLTVLIVVLWALDHYIFAIAAIIAMILMWALSASRKQVYRQPPLDRRDNEALSYENDRLSYSYTRDGITHEYSMAITDITKIIIWPSRYLVYFMGGYSYLRTKNGEYIDSQEYTAEDPHQLSVPYYFKGMDELISEISSKTGIEPSITQ